MTISANSTLNSQRRISKVTYTPVTTLAQRDSLIANAPAISAPVGDALGLAAMVRALQVTQQELIQLKTTVRDPGAEAALDAMSTLATAVSGARALAGAAALAQVARADLVTVAIGLGELRSAAFTQLIDGLRQLDDGYTQAMAAILPPPPAPKPPAIDPAAPPGVSLTPALFRPGAVLQIQPIFAASLGLPLVSRIDSVLTWAAAGRSRALRTLIDAFRGYLPATPDDSAPLAAIPVLQRLQLLPQLFIEALSHRPLEPVGLLHLERLVLSPLGVERGELLYSLPIAPKEKVTLAHKEWSTTEKEYQSFVEDSFENYSEQGTAQTNDLAMSSGVQSQHSNATSMNSMLSSATGVGTTSAVDASSTTTSASAVDDQTTLNESKGQTRSVTAQASARTIKDQKVSFTVTTVSGSQDFTARVLENTFDDRSMLIDYYRRMRQWRNELYRYGVRLTYDVVLPDPGRNLRQRVLELHDLQEQLRTPFDVGYVPSEITLQDWQQRADEHGAKLPAPPTSQRIETTKLLNAGSFVGESQLTIPPDLQLDSLSALVEGEVPPAAHHRIRIGGSDVLLHQVTVGDTSFFEGGAGLDVDKFPQAGPITVAFDVTELVSGVLRLLANVVPTDAAMAAWRFQCWIALSGADFARYQARQDSARQRVAALTREIGADDALTLRRHEREQIMRSVLQWLFPGFGATSSVLEGLPDPTAVDDVTWDKVMEYGEYIKFVQDAIDWENVLVVLYPYFWDTAENQQLKLFLDHPDSIHQEFLRAGAARIILAVRPNYEEALVSLLDQGHLGPLDQNHRFRKVIDDVKAANAKYAESVISHIAGDDDPQEPGVLVGSWHDFTPTSALDIEVTTIQVTAR